MSATGFKRPHPASLRLWHWLNAITIFGLLGTVVLRKTFLSWRANSVLIESKITEAGGTIDPAVAKGIAVSIRDNMWEIHVLLGFALVALMVLRHVVVAITKKVPPKEALEAFRAASRASGTAKKDAMHFAMAKLSYVFFYLVVVFMSATGLAMVFGEALGLSKETFHTIKEIHEVGALPVWIFVGLHLVGVVVAELTKHRGIVSNMISGGNAKS